MSSTAKENVTLCLQEGRVYACGEGTNGRLGLSHSNNVSSPRQMTVLSQYVVKKVAVHSGGKHAMALTVDGKVFSWGELIQCLGFLKWSLIHLFLTDFSFYH